MPLPPLENSGSRLQQIARSVQGALVTGLLGVSLLGFNLIQTASLVLRPISDPTFRRVNRWAAETWWGWCAGISLHLHRTRVVFTGDPLPEGENALLIANHQSMSDIQMLLLLGRRERRLGDFKWFVKEKLKYVPGVGWGMAFLDCLFVKRNWTQDEGMIRRTFARIREAEIPVWLVAFVEGTRLTPRNLSGSQDWASQRRRTGFRHLLVPRPRGFAASVTGLRDHLTAVYDVTIGYVEGIPSLWQWAQGRVRQVHLDVRRFALPELPAEVDELRAWLLERFGEKDRRLDHFYRLGTFEPAE